MLPCSIYLGHIESNVLFIWEIFLEEIWNAGNKSLAF